MLRYLNQFSNIGKFGARSAVAANMIHALGLRPKTAYVAAVAATGAEMEAAA